MGPLVVCLVAWLAPLATTGQGAAASVNPYNGREERQEVFEFAERPRVEKQGDQWTISFASKAACDATVAIVDNDGKVVRHLASGVLGKNAPWPFQQDALSQRIEWDGKDDSGRPAPPGCRARVSLGLRARFDRVLGWSPSAPRTEVEGVAVDAHGQLYVLSGGPSLRVFDRQGSYLRTLMPHAANVPPGQMALIEWNQTTWATQAVHRPRSGGSSTFDLFRFANFGFPKQGMVITPDGRLALVTRYLSWNLKDPGRRLVLLSSRDGAAPPGSLAQLDRGSGGWKPGALGNDGRPFAALSPDGRKLYLSGFARKDPRAKRSAIHAVFAVPLDPPGRAERLLGDPAAPGPDNEHFNEPRGLACDRDGHLYVCDYGNDRLQVLKPDGGHLKSIPVEKPDQVAVHPKTGEIYVLRAPRADRHFKAQVVKLAGLAHPAVRATLPLPTNQFSIHALMALDAAAEPPALWLAAAEGKYGVNRALWRFEDRGDKLEKVLDVAAVAQGPKGWGDWDPHSKRVYVAVDPFREELYIRLGDCCFPSQAIRVDGRSGRLIERLEARIEQICVGPDKSVYLRIEDGGEWLARYDPEARKFVPLTAPEAQPVRQGGYGSKKYDFSKRKRVSFRGQPVLGVYAPAAGGGRTWQDPFGVAPNGDAYIPAGIVQEHIAAMEKAGLPRPAKPFGTNFCVLQVYSSEGKLKCVSALPGLGLSSGVRVGRGGAVYIVLACQPAGQKLPEGLAPGGTFVASEWGTLVKFNSTLDKFPVGSIIGRWGATKPDKPTHHYGNCGGSFNTGRGTPVVIENLLWDYGGVCPVTLSGCTCMNSLFDLDRFERCFVPAAQTSTVNVLDANGNIVVRLGAYGNADSRGKDSPVLDPQTGLLRPRRPDDPPDLKSPLAEPDLAFAFPKFVAVTDEALYVHDEENERIVRAVLGYHAEETAPLP